jgi:hypothetical protein
MGAEISMIDLSKTKAQLDVQTLVKLYEIRWLQNNRLQVANCKDEMLTSVLSQILKDGHTLTRVTLL